MLTEKGMLLFEEAIRTRLVARQKELNLSDKALGQMAFPFRKNPLGKVRSLLIAQGSGIEKKPQNMRATDLINLFQSMGLNWREEIGKALKESDGK